MILLLPNIQGGTAQLDYASILLGAGFLLIVVGFILVLLSFTGRGERETKGFGVLLLGPFPIVFGTEKGWTRRLTLLSLLFILVFFCLFFLPHYLR